VLTGVAAVFHRAATESKDWLDIFKSGFLLLGGGVTTIIGYYFGSRQTTRAFEAAERGAAASAGTAPIEEPSPKGPLRQPTGSAGPPSPNP